MILLYWMLNVCASYDECKCYVDFCNNCLPASLPYHHSKANMYLYIRRGKKNAFSWYRMHFRCMSFTARTFPMDICCQRCEYLGCLAHTFMNFSKIFYLKVGIRFPLAWQVNPGRFVTLVRISLYIQNPKSTNPLISDWNCPRHDIMNSLATVLATLSWLLHLPARVNESLLSSQ